MAHDSIRVEAAGRAHVHFTLPMPASLDANSELVFGNSLTGWLIFFLSFFFFFFCLLSFLGLHPRHMEVPRLEV